MIALLKDGTPFVVTNNVVILTYEFEKLVGKVNLKHNSNKISEILGKMLGRDVFVYALSRVEGVRLARAFQNLGQINRLPLRKDIKIDLEELRK